MDAAHTDVPQWRSLTTPFDPRLFVFSIHRFFLPLSVLHCDILRMTDEGCASKTAATEERVYLSVSLFMYISGSVSEGFRRVASGSSDLFIFSLS